MRIDSGSKNELTPDAVHSALDRLLGSHAFAQSTRLSRFLKFGVEAALSDRATVNEYSIGVDVFEKKGGFDPRIDPIVRVHARRLRSKLKQYYDTEGIDDPIEISLPLRTYVPVFRLRPARSLAEKRPAAFHTTTEVADSILVLPFTNLSSSKDDDYFAEGLTQELIHALSGVKEWRVIAWHSGGSEARQPNFRELAKQLNAGATLWGTIRNNQGSLRISAELSSIPDRTVLWSQMYVFDSDDPLGTQERLARTICQGLRARAETQSATPAAGTKSPEARKRCLEGCHMAQRRSRKSLERSVHYLSEAIAADPMYAAAHAGLAETFVLMATDADYPPEEVMPKAARAAAEAVEYDPGLAEGHLGLGLVAAIYECDLSAAESEFLHAIELDPKAPALAWHAAACLTPAGRFHEAIEYLERAEELDPLSPAVRSYLAYAYCAAGNPGRAVEHLTESLDLEPDFALTHWTLGVAYVTSSRLASAIEAFEEASRLSEDSSYAQAALGHAYALAGRTGEAASILNRLGARSRDRYVPATASALIHLGLGEYDEAFRCLEAATVQRCAWRHRLATDPRVHNLRTDTRFTRFFQRLRSQRFFPAIG